MGDRIRVLIKSLISEKNTVAAVWKLIISTIAYISSIFTFSVLINDWLGFDKVEYCCKNYWWVLILIGIVASFIHNHEKISCKASRKNDDFRIKVRVNDIFSCTIKATSYVIPTNSFFRTKMEREYISPESVQGAFQLKYFKNDVEKLDEMIAESIEEQGIQGDDSFDKFGSVKKYPIGTVSKVDYNGKHFYFVAVTDVNNYGKPINQNVNNVDKALSGLIDAINRMGHCDDLAMPLIGTGRAAMREATIERVLEDTVDRFLLCKYKVARKLIICISPKDYLDGKADMKKIAKYLDYRCGFEQDKE